jgi:hypothetical protein
MSSLPAYALVSDVASDAARVAESLVLDLPVSERRVMLLLDRRALAWSMIQHAARIANTLDAELCVVLAVGQRALTDQSRVCCQISDLLETVGPRRGYQIHVRRGVSAQVGVTLGREHDIMLVVVDSRYPTADTCHLVEELAVPVFVARDPDAAVVVIGHGPRSWWARILGRGERVLERSRGSVLVVPRATRDQPPSFA